MVGPIPDEERRDAAFRLKTGFVALVGVSAGLITLQGDPSPVVVGAAVLVGLLLGGGLVWVLFPGTGETRDDRGRNRDGGRGRNRR